ncbi:MAG: fasciclin domain-containing protein [Mycobacterium sp.]
MNLSMNTTKIVGAACTAAVASGLLFASAGVASAELVGPGCAAYAAQNPEGPASVTGMAMDPVAVAASNNPMLKTLTQAVSGQLNPNVNLVDTLNSAPSLTVFAPTDEAFAKIDPATVEKLKTDSALLTSILTYHVVEGQASPEQVVGTHKTMQGADLTVVNTSMGMGMPGDLKVNDATVACGGVQTANATVYLIDTVLMPPM